MDLSLVTGWLPAALTIAGLLALAGLIALPPRRSWWVGAALIVAGSGLLVVLINFFVVHIWQPFPDTIPTEILLWAWGAIAALGLGVGQLLTGGRHWVWRVVGGLVALVAVVGMVTQINRFYGEYPTVGTALGVTTPDLVDLAGVPRSTATVEPADYQPPADLPAKGVVAKIRVDPVESGFHARPGYVYLPPAYLTSPRPLLPVVVLLAGQPGNADEWLVSGQLTRMLDGYAKAHDGLAPIVVMVDNLGSNFVNPLCVDGNLGKVETYLAKDVPAWVHRNLQTAQGPDKWVIAGLSNGGTCSLQLATRAPQVYGRFVDISGEYQPLDGSKEKTIQKIFSGDAARYRAINPIDIMAERKFPDTAGRFVAGKDDSVYYPQQKQAYEAAKAAGMDVSWLELPGGHTWQVWRPGLEQSLDWIAEKTGLSRS